MPNRAYCSYLGTIVRKGSNIININMGRLLCSSWTSGVHNEKDIQNSVTVESFHSSHHIFFGINLS